MDCWSDCPYSLERHSSSLRGSGCWSTSSEVFSIPPSRDGNIPKITNLVLGEQKPKEDIVVKRLSTIQPADFEKQFGWKYWQWPPPTRNSIDDFCSIPSDTALLHNVDRLCVGIDNLQNYAACSKVTSAQLRPSKTFMVSPTSLRFSRNVESGQWEEFLWLKVQNKGNMTRRLNLVPPKHPAFTVVWAAALNEKTSVPPGLYLRILIQCVPTTQEPINDSLFIRVENDGEIRVPLEAIIQDPPILELEDFSCGCCLLNLKVTKTFIIKNFGGKGRFWLLSEAEFTNECNEVAPPVEQKSNSSSIEELGEEEANEEAESDTSIVEIEDVSGITEISDLPFSTVPPNSPTIGKNSEIDETLLEIEKIPILKPIEKQDEVIDENKILWDRSEVLGEYYVAGEDETEDSKPPPNSPAEPKRQLDKLLIPPFRLRPTSFALERKQEIKVKVSFQPSHPTIYHEKVAVLCDNGEVRWIILKGLGIEPKTQKIYTLHMDNHVLDGERKSIDLGRLCSEESVIKTLRLRNGFSLPVFFFWEIGTGMYSPGDIFKRKTCANNMNEDFKIYSEDDGEIETRFPFVDVPLTISPAQGLLRGCAEVVCELNLTCPDALGYFENSLSLRFQQLSEESMRAVVIMTEKELEREIQIQIQHETPPYQKPNLFSVETYMNLPKFRIPPIPSEPTHELQIWFESVPIPCWFEPSILIGSGIAFTQKRQKIKFFNNSKYQVVVSLKDLQSQYCNVTISPTILKVSEKSHACFRLTLRFQSIGKVECGVMGVIELPFKKVDVVLPLRIHSVMPIICNEPITDCQEKKGEELQIQREEVAQVIMINMEDENNENENGECDKHNIL